MLISMQNQKTMCKHLLEAPYIHQVVDDPILAANVSLLVHMAHHLNKNTGKS